MINSHLFTPARVATQKRACSPTSWLTTRRLCMHGCMCTVKNKNMLGNSRATARAACEARLLAGSMRADAASLSCWCTDETPEYAPYGTDASKPWETTLTRHHLASLQRMDNELLGLRLRRFCAWPPNLKCRSTATSDGLKHAPSMMTESREGIEPSVAWCLTGRVRSFYVPLVHESIMRNAIRAVSGNAKVFMMATSANDIWRSEHVSASGDSDALCDRKYRNLSHFVSLHSDWASITQRICGTLADDQAGLARRTQSRVIARDRRRGEQVPEAKHNLREYSYDSFLFASWYVSAPTQIDAGARFVHFGTLFCMQPRQAKTSDESFLPRSYLAPTTRLRLPPRPRSRHTSKLRSKRAPARLAEPTAGTFGPVSVTWSVSVSPPGPGAASTRQRPAASSHAHVVKYARERPCRTRLTGRTAPPTIRGGSGECSRPCPGCSMPHGRPASPHTALDAHTTAACC